MAAALPSATTKATAVVHGSGKTRIELERRAHRGSLRGHRHHGGAIYVRGNAPTSWIARLYGDDVRQDLRTRRTRVFERAGNRETELSTLFINSPAGGIALREALHTGLNISLRHPSPEPHAALHLCLPTGIPTRVLQPHQKGKQRKRSSDGRILRPSECRSALPCARPPAGALSRGPVDGALEIKAREDYYPIQSRATKTRRPEKLTIIGPGRRSLAAWQLAGGAIRSRCITRPLISAGSSAGQFRENDFR
jgi:hypothetical protein